MSPLRFLIRGCSLAACPHPRMFLLPSPVSDSPCASMAASFPTQHGGPRVQNTALAILAGPHDLPVEEICGHGTPPTASSSSRQLYALDRDTPRIINIPFRILLDITLQEIGFPKAEYHLELSENNEVRVTILLNTSASHVQTSLAYLSITGIKSRSYETAEDSACQKAIEYIEETTNSVVRDLSYARLAYVKEMYRDLLLKLGKTAEYKRKLARGWFLSVRHMSSFSEQILSIRSLYYSSGQDRIDVTWNNLLSNFRDLDSRLKRTGIVLEKRLESMRKDRFS